MATGPAFLVTVDVEEDMPRWVPEQNITVHNVEGLWTFQRLCDEYGVRPTYLTSYCVATTKESALTMAELLAHGNCEIGAHLHPWNTPPLPHGPQTVALRATEIPCNLMRGKKDTLTTTLEQTFGKRPRSYRAGRFGFNGDCLRALEELNYQVDSSITPGVSWKEEGGEDFTDAPEHPYFPDSMDPIRRGNSSIYEVPVSIGLTRQIPQWLRRLYLHVPRWTKLRGLLGKHHLGVVDQQWLYPVQGSAEDLIRCADTLVESGKSVLNVFMHSSEAFPSTSIYNRSESDVAAYLCRLRLLFDHVMNRMNGKGFALTEFRNASLGENASHLPDSIAM